MKGGNMEYFKDYDSVKEYIDMSQGYDGRFLIEILHDFLPFGKSLLELGIGPGRDFEILEKNYKVTGSDYSNIFLNLFRDKNKNADLIELDASSLKTKRTWDSIFSNKVLHHLDRGMMKKSLEKQLDILNERGLVLHSFWKGQGKEILKGMEFVYYEKEELVKIFDKYFDVLTCEEYTENDENDSIYIIGRKR